MSCTNKRSILPQVGYRAARSVTLLVCFTLLGSVLVGCVSVSLQAKKPEKPTTVAQANAYLNGQSAELERMNYELNQRERACYERFMVSDCVDAVRAKRAEYRRSHIEAEAAANDLIRIEKLTSKRGG